MLEEATRHIMSLLAGMPLALLTSRGPGRPPIPDEPEVVLLSPRRRAIFRLVQREPGLSLSEIARRLEIPSGAFYGHIEKMMAAGLIEKRYVGAEARVYPGEEAPPPDEPALSNDSAKAVAQLVAQKAGLSSREIADQLGVTQRTAQLRLRDLLEAGYVEQEPTGAAPLYHPTKKLLGELSRK